MDVGGAGRSLLYNVLHTTAGGVCTAETKVHTPLLLCIIGAEKRRGGGVC